MHAVGDKLSEDEDGQNIGATAMFEDFFGARSGMLLTFAIDLCLPWSCTRIAW